MNLREHHSLYKNKGTDIFNFSYRFYGWHGIFVFLVLIFRWKLTNCVVVFFSIQCIYLTIVKIWQEYTLLLLDNKYMFHLWTIFYFTSQWNYQLCTGTIHCNILLINYMDCSNVNQFNNTFFLTIVRTSLLSRRVYCLINTAFLL